MARPITVSERASNRNECRSLARKALTEAEGLIDRPRAAVGLACVLIQFAWHELSSTKGPLHTAHLQAASI